MDASSTIAFAHVPGRMAYVAFLYVAQPTLDIPYSWNDFGSGGSCIDAARMAAMEHFRRDLWVAHAIDRNIGNSVASQLIWCAVLAKTFAITEGLIPKSARWESVSKWMTLERLLALSGGLALAGGAIIAGLAAQWASTGFGPLHYATSMRWVILRSA